MGKAKRLLNAARKEVFAGILGEGAPPPEEPIDHRLEAMERESAHRMFLIDTAYRARSRIFSYVEENAYPLCEFLDMDNMVNYIEWLLDRPERF